MSNLAIGLGISQVGGEPSIWALGERTRLDSNDRLFSATWTGAPINDVWTITTTGATDSTAYTLTFAIIAGGMAVPSRSVTYTSGTSATTATISAGLLAAVVADPILNAYLTASADSSTVNRFTSRGGSISFTPTEASSDLGSPSHVATASVGSSIGFGRFVIRDTTKLTNPTPQALPTTSLTAKVSSGTIVYAANAVYSVDITFRGVKYTAFVVADTNTATTLTALLAAINAMMPANSVVATSGGAGAYTLTAEVVGDSFTANVAATGGTFTYTDVTLLTDDITKCWLGFTLRDTTIENTAIGSNTAEYRPGLCLGGIGYGRVCLDTTDTPAAGDPVYVLATTGAAYKTAGAGTVFLPGAFWSGRGSNGLYEAFVANGSV